MKAISGVQSKVYSDISQELQERPESLVLKPHTTGSQQRVYESLIAH
jgi:hypothetical protein